jgi:membrane protein implicated in regulation of membrane protease activity
MTLYLAGLATGGILLLFSLAGGADADAGDADAELDAEGGEAEAEADDAHHGGSAHGRMALSALALTALPIRSLRFWTFFLAFGGLAGTLLSWLAPLGSLAVAILAAAVGYGAGVGATILLRWAQRDQVSSTLRPAQCVGASGTVLLPVAPGARGRIRVALEDQVVDFDAETEDEDSLDLAEPVVVYAVREDGVALVTSTRLKPARTL